MNHPAEHDYSQEAAARLYKVLTRRGQNVQIDALRGEVDQLKDEVYREHTRRRIGSGVMDAIAGKVIERATTRRTAFVSRWLVKQGLAYSRDQMAHEQAHGENVLEHPAVGAAAWLAEFIPEAAEPIAEVISSAAPVVGNIIAGVATGGIDIGIGTAVGIAHARSYKAVPDLTDPAGKEQISHPRAQAVALALGITPTVFANATAGLAISKGFGRALTRQLKDHPVYGSAVNEATTRAARIGIGRRHGLHH